MPDRALLLVGHGTVEKLDDLEPFVTNVRRGHAPPPELVAELRRRYDAIGGKSPLLSISRELAAKVEAVLSVPTRVAMRLWHPYPNDVLAELGALGAHHVAVVALAQHSANVYADAVRAAASELASRGGPSLTLSCGENWGQTPHLIEAYAETIREALGEVPKEERAQTTVLMTAHSLPKSVVDAGDPYEREVRASAVRIGARIGDALGGAHLEVAYQSQGMGTGPGGRPIEWMGPTIQASLDRIADRGDRHVIFAPIGFLADHVEILYDLDVEATAQAKARDLVPHRAPSLNARDSLVRAIVAVARPLLDRHEAGQGDG